jgi:hypothetical protein
MESEEPEARAELMRDYTALACELRQEEEQLINSQSPRAMTAKLERHDRLFSKVKTAATMTHDCESLTQILRIAVSQTTAFNLSPKSISLQNVRSNLLRRFGDGALDLERLGDWSLRKSRVPGAAAASLFGLGQFTPILRPRTQRQRSVAAPIEAMKAVDQRTVPDGRAEQLLSRARALCDKLKTSGDTPLTRAIAAPTGFAQTVQNAFDFAHLVRDGRVGLQLVDSCLLATAEVGRLQTGERRRQCILHLRQSDYQRLVEDPLTTAELVEPSI